VKFNYLDEVAQELTKPEFEGVNDSESEEEETESQEFGAHIYLDDLTGMGFLITFFVI
jgi:hypothetical protein